jgi:hypothetical protein
VFDDAMRAFLRTGCALIVATVDDDGEPRASRGWGIGVLSEDPPLVRLLVDADDDATLAQLAGGCTIAITAASVRTLESVQLKGHGRGVEPGTPEDQVRTDQYVEAFFRDIEDTDGTERRLLLRIRPDRVAACTVDLVEAFDQTPGPTAGARRPMT